jgi:nucleoside-diphosphate-sugar epimerase
MILITGATGNIGKELIPILLDNGQSIRSWCAMNTRWLTSNACRAGRG